MPDHSGPAGGGGGMAQSATFVKIREDLSHRGRGRPGHPSRPSGSLPTGHHRSGGRGTNRPIPFPNGSGYFSMLASAPHFYVRLDRHASPHPGGALDGGSCAMV